MTSSPAQRVAEQVLAARASGTTLAIRGHASKRALLGERRADAVLDMRACSGVLSYRPDELVITVRAGTPLKELEAVLAERRQHIAPGIPLLEGQGTVGGAVAAGLSGPSRPWRGSLRDVILGVEMVNGLGERLRFGGEVFKNVAGFDVARLVTGSEGAFGALLSVSLRVAPVPECTRCLVVEMPATPALTWMRRRAAEPHPFGGLCWLEGRLHCRLDGAAQAVADFTGEPGMVEEDPAFWTQLRDAALPFLAGWSGLWRCAVPPATPPDEQTVCIDWAGALRWRRGSINTVGESCPVGSSPLALGACDGLLSRLKAAFDPDHLFNPELMRADAPA
ncbi:MAG: glycolate oxidase subunit GlcE [Pseudomonadales bacterium]